MMKRIFGMLLVFTLLLAGSAFAAETIDVPGAPTQDAVLTTSATWQDEAQTAYGVQAAEADQLTTDTLADVYTFVVDEGNRPVRYFPADVQEAIAAMAENADALYMPDFMRLTAPAADAQADLTMVMELDAKYEPGQFVVAVLGDITDPAAIVWTALETKVIAEGKVECLIPQGVAAQVQGEDVLFCLLTVRPGEPAPVEPENGEAEVSLPSKTADDIAGVEAIAAEDSAIALAADFEVAVVAETEKVTAVAAELQDHVKTAGLPASEFFGEETEQALQSMLGDSADVKTMVVYEYASVVSYNYKEEYNNIIATFNFATPYADGQKIVAVVGLADGEDLTWVAQRAEVKDGAVEIVFDRLAMTKMGETPAMLVLLSEAIAE